MDDLFWELSGDFATMVDATLRLPSDYDAKCLYNAIRGWGTDEDTITEILVSRNAEQINKIKESYRRCW